MRNTNKVTILLLHVILIIKLRYTHLSVFIAAVYKYRKGKEQS